MNYLEQAKKLELEINYCCKNESYGSHYGDFIKQAKSLRSTIFGVSMMKQSKSKEDEEAVKILDAILGADE